MAAVLPIIRIICISSMYIFKNVNDLILWLLFLLSHVKSEKDFFGYNDDTSNIMRTSQ